jgi:hypothetical protein
MDRSSMGMKRILTFLFLLSSALGLGAANPSVTQMFQAIPWTNQNGVVKSRVAVPVLSDRVFWAGSNALDLTQNYFTSSNGVLVGFDATDASQPYNLGIGAVLKGPGSFTFTVTSTEVYTNHVYGYVECENDDVGFLHTVEWAAGTNITEMANGFGPQIQGTSGIFGNNQYFRLIPFSGNPYVFKSGPLGQSNVLSVMNDTTNAFTVTYDGNLTNMGRHSATLGFASFSTIATNQIPATGWTNNAEINVTVYTTATAVSFTINNRAGAVLYTSPVLTATMPVNLQPGWSVRAASGLTGTAVPF